MKWNYPCPLAFVVTARFSLNFCWPISTTNHKVRAGVEFSVFIIFLMRSVSLVTVKTVEMKEAFSAVITSDLSKKPLKKYYKERLEQHQPKNASPSFDCLLSIKLAKFCAAEKSIFGSRFDARTFLNDFEIKANNLTWYQWTMLKSKFSDLDRHFYYFGFQCQILAENCFENIRTQPQFFRQVDYDELEKWS